MRYILALIALCLVVSSASAHPYRHHHHYYHHHHYRHYVVRYWHVHYRRRVESRIEPNRYEFRHADPRPREWCSWWLRQTLGVPLGIVNNLALSWLHWGHPSAPEVGAVVIWSHGHGHGHVGIIRGGPDSRGLWLVESGNDGHAVRTRYRSIASAVGFRIE